jgi:hypothetical protein
MDLATFRRNFPPDVAVPDRLSGLLEFQNESREWYTGYFEMVEWEYGFAAWFGGDKIAAEQFVVFGHDGDGSLYALWLYPGRSIGDAPVVFLGSEGVDCSLLASDLDAFLGLLALGVQELGFAVSWGDVRPPDSPAPRLHAFQEWLRMSFGITPSPDPIAMVTLARRQHPDFGLWLSDWMASH